MANKLSKLSLNKTDNPQSIEFLAIDAEILGKGGFSARGKLVLTFSAEDAVTK